jgi:hypothetical protein
MSDVTAARKLVELGKGRFFASYARRGFFAARATPSIFNPASLRGKMQVYPGLLQLLASTIIFALCCFFAPKWLQISALSQAEMGQVKWDLTPLGIRHYRSR